MNEEAGEKKSSTYTASPTVPEELLPRLAAILQVLSGLKTMSEAARQMNLSRNHFQSIVHRAMYAMIDTLRPKEPGRPGKPQDLSELERRLKKLERENVRLKKRVEATDELIMVAGELLHGQRRPGQHPRRARKKSAATDPEESESEPHERLLQAVDRMHALGLTYARAAWLAGLDAATVRRWRTCRPQKAPCARQRAPSLTARLAAEQLVRELHGLLGADSLRHSIAGLTRRQAAAIKAGTLTAMERERQAAAVAVHVLKPGVIRGFDAMMKVDGARHALICADAAVPFRTSATLTKHYDERHVARALQADFERHGAPLVLRDDRAHVHEAPEVRAVLEAHAVLILHGPPRYPRFYGQLERQNREHRAWLAALNEPSGLPMEQLIEKMLYCLNTLWRRPTLEWKTAAEIWNARTPISINTRRAFREEVYDRTQRIRCALNRRGKPTDLAERLAIEQTLTNMGYLHQQIGRRC
jgi:hypothetical protein